MSEPARCATCPHYRAPREGEPGAVTAEGPGECRRRSPRAYQDRGTGGWRSIWPLVWGARDWCSEHPELIEARQIRMVREEHGT